MRVTSVVILCIFNYVYCKNNVKSLTESMGQEVIEIGTPIKELPQELEEEPAAENYEDRVTTTTIQVATKKEFLKTTSDPGKKVKDVDKIDGRRREDDEAKIEKELADIYKDTIDYKADSAEVTKEENNTLSSEKPVERSRGEFKFQPDSDNPRVIAHFRTSVDEISCDKKLSGHTTSPPTNAGKKITTQILFWITFLSKFHI